MVLSVRSFDSHTSVLECFKSRESIEGHYCCSGMPSALITNATESSDGVGLGVGLGLGFVGFGVTGFCAGCFAG